MNPASNATHILSVKLQLWTIATHAANTTAANTHLSLGNCNKALMTQVVMAEANPTNNNFIQMELLSFDMGIQ